MAFESGDAARLYAADKLTPTNAAALLKAADAGDVGAVLQLFEEIAERDTRLVALLRKRRLALTGLPWEIVPASEVFPDNRRMDAGAAQEAAAFCGEELMDLVSFNAALGHLAYGIHDGIAVAELVWNFARGRMRLGEIAAVPVRRLRFDYAADQRLRILTAEQAQGIPAEPGAGKFVIHAPTSRSGFPQRGSLLRVLTFNYLARTYLNRWWATRCEIFGMPVRTARYSPGASAEEKNEALRMLRLLATDAVAIFSESMRLEFVETSQAGVSPYESFIKLLDEEMTIAVLGQTLTTQMSEAGGSYAAARVHQGVEDALADDDRKAEAETIREQLLRPMIDRSFPRTLTTVPVPFFRRVVEEPRDQLQTAQVIQTAVNFGLNVPSAWAHETLGIPEAAAGEATVQRPANPVPPGYGGGMGGFAGNLN